MTVDTTQLARDSHHTQREESNSFPFCMCVYLYLCVCLCIYVCMLGTHTHTRTSELEHPSVLQPVDPRTYTSTWPIPSPRLSVSN